jgi:hypothetical protein
MYIATLCNNLFYFLVSKPVHILHIYVPHSPAHLHMLDAHGQFAPHSAPVGALSTQPMFLFLPSGSGFAVASQRYVCTVDGQLHFRGTCTIRTCYCTHLANSCCSCTGQESPRCFWQQHAPDSCNASEISKLRRATKRAGVRMTDRADKQEQCAR